MIKKIIIIAGIVIPTVMLSSLLIMNKSTIGSSKNAKEVSISIDGMTCESCHIKIKKELNTLRGIESINIDGSNNQAKIIYNEKKVSLKEMKNKISEAGYSSVTPEEDTLEVVDYKIRQNRKSTKSVKSAKICKIHKNLKKEAKIRKNPQKTKKSENRI